MGHIKLTMKLSYILIPCFYSRFIQIGELADDENDPLDKIFQGFFNGFSQMAKIGGPLDNIISSIDKQFSESQLISERDEIFKDPFMQMGMGGFFQPLKSFKETDDTVETIGDPEIVDIEEVHDGKKVKKHQVKEHIKDAQGHKLIKNTIDEDVMSDDGKVVMHKHQTFTTSDDDEENSQQQIFSSSMSSSSSNQMIGKPGLFLNKFLDAFGFENQTEMETNENAEEPVEETAEVKQPEKEESHLDRLADVT